MEALIVDINADLELIKKEVESIKRKINRLKTEKDPENIDSHIKAVAGSLHSIYTGYESIIERIVRAMDGETPLGKDYHLKLLRRAITEIPNCRPPIISRETFVVLDELRTYRHKFRHIYIYMISPARIIELAEQGIKSFEFFNRDIDKFKEHLRKVSLD